MMLIKPPNDFHAGTKILDIKKEWDLYRKDYFTSGPYDYHLDLSEVIYMDSASFRLVFDYLPIFKKVTPPKSTYVIEMYNMWLDSKKGLKK
jgi:hypothetical protein